MPLYRFECDNCGFQDTVMMTFEQHDEDRALGPVGCARCIRGGEVGKMRQVYDFHFNRGMTEHYSDQLDTYVTSERDWNDQLRRHADAYTARTGMETSFDIIDPNDPAAAGVTEVGLESQERVQHNEAADGHRSTFS